MQENRDISLREFSGSAEQGRQKALWFWQFRAFGRALHTHTGTLGGVLQSLDGLGRLEDADKGKPQAAFQAWLYQQWQNLPCNPRQAGSDTVVCSTYDSWFACTPFSELNMSRPESWCSDYVQYTAGLNKMHLSSLMRFRLGSHDLRVVTGRWERVDNSSLPRHQRLCERCAAGQVEDEFHVVFECDAYLAVREHFWKLFVDFGHWNGSGNVVSPGGRTLADFMQQRQSRVAAFTSLLFDAERS